MVDSRETEVELMEQVRNLIVLCKIKKKLNGRMMIKIRPSVKVVVHTKEVIVLIKEEVILILEVVFIIIVSNVVKKGIDSVNVEHLKVGKVTKILWYKETLRVC